MTHKFLAFYRDVVELRLRPPESDEHHFIKAAYRARIKASHACVKAHNKWAHEAFNKHKEIT